MAQDVVGARELKIRLGAYLQQVRQGRTLVVTDRGLPIAELRPLAAATGRDAAFAKLEARRVVTRPTRKRLQPFRAIERRAGSLTSAVSAGRGDRF